MKFTNGLDLAYDPQQSFDSYPRLHMNDYDSLSYPIAAESEPDERARFISRTYAHVAGAILLFVALEWVMLNSSLAPAMMGLIGAGRLGWAVVLLSFMGISWVARWMADNHASPAMQYGGLGLYTFAEAVIFLPILFIATNMAKADVVPIAAAITGALFLGLTAVAFTTKKDFSFLGAILKVGGMVALGVIAASMLFGFNLGVLFAAVMVVFAAGSILYDTSNIMFRYSTRQHVAASLSLFASVMLLFWYVLRIVMSRRN